MSENRFFKLTRSSDGTPVAVRADRIVTLEPNPSDPTGTRVVVDIGAEYAAEYDVRESMPDILYFLSDRLVRPTEDKVSHDARFSRRSA